MDSTAELKAFCSASGADLAGRAYHAGRSGTIAEDGDIAQCNTFKPGSLQVEK